MSSSASIDYAHLLGIQSLAGAVVFGALYIPLLIIYLWKMFRKFSRVVLFLVLFCMVRIAAFTIRALLTPAGRKGDNLSLVIAEEVLSAVGFFGLLFAAYTLVKEGFHSLPEDTTFGAYMRRFLDVMDSRLFFRGAMTIGVSLSIVGAVDISNARPGSRASSNGTTFVRVSAIIFLVLTIVQGVYAGLLMCKDGETQTDGATRMGLVGEAALEVEKEEEEGNAVARRRRASAVLCAITGLLLVREVFLVATVRPTNEHVWYPLVAVPEIVAVMLFVDCA